MWIIALQLIFGNHDIQSSTIDAVKEAIILLVSWLTLLIISTVIHTLGFKQYDEPLSTWLCCLLVLHYYYTIVLCSPCWLKLLFVFMVPDYIKFIAFLLTFFSISFTIFANWIRNLLAGSEIVFSMGKLRHVFLMVALYNVLRAIYCSCTFFFCKYEEIVIQATISSFFFPFHCSS